MKSIHIMLVYATVIGFVIRSIWAFTDNPLRGERWVRTVPHVIDTLLLILGVIMAYQISQSPFSGWLLAKLIGLLAYILFGVLTLRATAAMPRAIGFVGAMTSVGYMFAVAFTRDPLPL
ncbi:MAG: SirB2 family protein [Pseudomonadales bacterium]|jgi:uncharacterized membrane protein SirB2|nr:SirB2 family protein [Pseudomonadales bacterium]MDP6470081.1 SirB2 family protein [Pseudomonadales bacterium]MDP6826984.1 SirB2 family protein [Pseudomonadales bacterium]MDP6971079.1 SirB2 family protein [Pseudomonadales bacterium]|tara:strand:- start:3059 stop:3415 length:357 start_codon:yes stop_codon:yes gene_type:complete